MSDQRKRLKQLERKTYLAETEEGNEAPRELEAMSEEERKEFQERMNGRISQWLQMYLESNPEKQKQVLECLEKSGQGEEKDF